MPNLPRLIRQSETVEILCRKEQRPVKAVCLLSQCDLIDTKALCNNTNTYRVLMV